MESIFDSPGFNQNLFFPRRDAQPAPPGTEDRFIEVAPSIRVHVRRHPNPEARFSLLYFHGNGEIVADYDSLGPVFGSLGAEFIVCDYRGYGKSDGFPTLRSVLQDAHILYRGLKEAGWLGDDVCVMGRSLGSASAIELCARLPEIRSCVIESGYADPIPLVERRGLSIAQTTSEEDALFNNSRKIKDVKCPLLILHGADDFLIDPREAQMNYEAAGSRDKGLQLLEGVGHNDIMMSPDYFAGLKRFFDQVM